MQAIVFYAWQSDTPARANRNLIRDAAEAACERITSDVSYDWEVTLDSDTRGVAGMCDIPNTILEKIEQCDIFLADLTFVGESISADGNRQKMPNCNVVFELGYAAKYHGFSSLVGIVNEAFGKNEGQIFDIKRRACISCNVPRDADPNRYSKEKERLAKTLEEVFRLTLDTVVARRREASTSRDVDEFERVRIEQASRVLRREFHGFGELPATAIIIKTAQRSELEFEALHEELRSNGLTPVTQADSLSWGNKSRKTEVTLGGFVVDAYGGDYELSKSQFPHTLAGRRNSARSIPSLLHAATVQKNIICHVHECCQLLNRLHVPTPWRIGVSLVGAQGFKLVSDSDESPRACDKNVIHLQSTVISDATRITDADSTARELRRPLDELCRHFGWPTNYWFGSNGHFTVRLIC